MAENTSKSLRNRVMYSVFVRNYSPEGTFEALRQDLSRIKALGVDILWLMPIHPIGEKARKGTVGSPYAISDYRKVNPDLGTVEDLKNLTQTAHELGMKVIIDVVYNHTSPDSWLAQNHPEWFYHKPDGSFGNRVGDWTDIIDLDYSNPGLVDYQIETLKMWAEIVDGFRCDVAPLVPLAFWLKAREAVEQVRPGCIWLAESVEPEFVIYNRANGIPALSDSQCYQAFDVCYDYDIFNTFRDYIEGKASLSDYAQAVNRQEGMYPDNYVKLRFLENHDRPRIRQFIRDEKALRNYMALLYFQKGMPLLFNGQEAGADHLPELFEKDPICWETGLDYKDLLTKLYALKKDPIFTDSTYTLRALPGDILVAAHEKGDARLVGIFSLRANAGQVQLELPDGEYENLLGGVCRVKNGCLETQGEPIVLWK